MVAGGMREQDRLILLMETATADRLPGGRRKSYHLARQGCGSVQGHQFWSAWKPPGIRSQRHLPSVRVILSDSAGKSNLLAVRQRLAGFPKQDSPDFPGLSELQAFPGTSAVGRVFARVHERLQAFTSVGRPGWTAVLGKKGSGL